MKSRFETLQELVAVKETKWKEKEARLIKEKEVRGFICYRLAFKSKPRYHST